MSKKQGGVVTHVYKFNEKYGCYDLSGEPRMTGFPEHLKIEPPRKESPVKADYILSKVYYNGLGTARIFTGIRKVAGKEKIYTGDNNPYGGKPDGILMYVKPGELIVMVSITGKRVGGRMIDNLMPHLMEMVSNNTTKEPDSLE